jgi:hypothetical protein
VKNFIVSAIFLLLLRLLKKSIWAERWYTWGGSEMHCCRVLCVKPLVTPKRRCKEYIKTYLREKKAVKLRTGLNSLAIESNFGLL